MRASVGFVTLLGACGFTASTQPDAVDAPSPDMIDAFVSLRVQDGLVAFWTFDDPNGTGFASETSGAAGGPVPLAVISGPGITAPAFADGTLTATLPGRLVSALNTRLATDCATTGGVTLEAWVKPGLAVQRTPSEPAFIVGLAANISERNIALLQGGDKWIGRVRTGAALDGKPELTSSEVADPMFMTHLVLVADATQRTLYVNNRPKNAGTPSPLQNWNPTYPIAVLDEYQHARQWVGSVALVALYKRALTPDEVKQNWVLGPSALR